MKHNLPHTCCWKWTALMWVLVGVKVAVIWASCKFLLARPVSPSDIRWLVLSQVRAAHIKAELVAAFRPQLPSVDVPLGFLFFLSVWTTSNEPKQNKMHYRCFEPRQVPFFLQGFFVMFLEKVDIFLSAKPFWHPSWNSDLDLLQSCCS